MFENFSEKRNKYHTTVRTKIIPYRRVLNESTQLGFEKKGKTHPLDVKSNQKKSTRVGTLTNPKGTFSKSTRSSCTFEFLGTFFKSRWVLLLLT